MKFFQITSCPCFLGELYQDTCLKRLTICLGHSGIRLGSKSEQLNEGTEGPYLNRAPRQVPGTSLTTLSVILFNHLSHTFT